MHLGGWSRLGTVLCALYGVLVLVVAYTDRPKLEYLQGAWLSEAADVVSEAVSKQEGREFTAAQFRDGFLDRAEFNTTWLEQVATSPSETQKYFSAAVARVNEKYRALIAALPERQRQHWQLAFASWVGGTVLLFSAGWTIRWVYRGFRNAT